MGIFSKRVNNVGAVSGMLAGLAFTLVYIFMHKGWLFIPGTNQFPDTVDGSLLGIQSTAIGAIGALINFGVAYAVSLSTADTPEDVKELVEGIRTPAGAAAAVDH
jgi:cation/acetate symporter